MRADVRVPWNRVTGLVVAVLVVLQPLVMGRAIWGLNAGLVVSYFVWVGRPPLRPDRRRGVAWALGVGVLVMLFHFAEEFAFGLPQRLPALFGYAWSDARFAAFNAAWLAVMAAAVPGIARGFEPATLVAWFFALVAGIANGLVHPLLAVWQGGYFPGLASAPVLLVVGVVLLRRLSEGAGPLEPAP